MASNSGQREKVEKNVMGKNNETGIGGHNRKA